MKVRKKFEKAIRHKHKTKLIQIVEYKRETEGRYKKNGLVLDGRPEGQTNECVVTGTLQIK